MKIGLIRATKKHFIHLENSERIWVETPLLTKFKKNERNNESPCRDGVAIILDYILSSLFCAKYTADLPSACYTRKYFRNRKQGIRQVAGCLPPYVYVKKFDFAFFEFKKNYLIFRGWERKFLGIATLKQKILEPSLKNQLQILSSYGGHINDSNIVTAFSAVVDIHSTSNRKGTFSYCSDVFYRFFFVLPYLILASPYLSVKCLLGLFYLLNYLGTKVKGMSFRSLSLRKIINFSSLIYSTILVVFVFIRLQFSPRNH